MEVFLARVFPNSGRFRGILFYGFWDEEDSFALLFFFGCLYDPMACLVAGEGRTRGCKQEPPLPSKAQNGSWSLVVISYKFHI